MGRRRRGQWTIKYVQEQTGENELLEGLALADLNLPMGCRVPIGGDKSLEKVADS